MKILRFLSVVPLLVLMACVAPTAKAPTVMEQELSREAAKHQEFVNQESLRKEQYSIQKNAEMETRLARLGARIMEGGVKLCRHIAVDKSRCLFKFHLKEGKEVNAYADGNNIYVTPAMMNFAKTDEELATILGHEYAHNLMGHVDAQTKNALAGRLLGMTLDILASAGGVGTGSIFSDAGAHIGGLSYSQDFENEADYIGLYIMANSGFDIETSANIWRRFSIKDNGQGIYTSTTHPTNPHRFLALTKAMEEIKRKKQQQKALIPEFKPVDKEPEPILMMKRR